MHKVISFLSFFRISVYMNGMEKKLKCPRCQNTDARYFYKGSSGWYCRRCISFQRVMLEEEMEPVSLNSVSDHAQDYILRYPLTEKQMEISVRCIEELQNRDCLVRAVCGAGKTEIVVGVIGWYLKRKKKVCFAISRRQVVLEVAERMRGYFKNASVVPVCGGYTDVTDGDLIVCTTHQLYRYNRAFDLLIIDEVDGYPYAGNPVLHAIAASSARGRKVYLTATPDDELKQMVKEGKVAELTLNSRPHGHPLPVPEIVILPEMILRIYLLYWLKKHEEHPRIVFVPSVRLASELSRFIGILMKNSYVSSKNEDRDEVIEEFRAMKSGIIVATTVLERGVTIPDADICIYHADSPSFTEAALIQMAGRAGRSFTNPYGDVLFLCRGKSDLCFQCRETIERANLDLL